MIAANFYSEGKFNLKQISSMMKINLLPANILKPIFQE